MSIAPLLYDKDINGEQVPFELKASFTPMGDQKTAIPELVERYTGSSIVRCHGFRKDIYDG